MIKNPKHKEHEDALNWIGGSFDPEIFDDTMVNYRLELEAQRLNDWNVVKDLFIEDPGDWVDPNLACQQWLKTLQKRDKEAIDALPLRKDVFTLLSYLRDNKVVGTTSTGNFPRKDVKEFAGLMTKNPEIDLRNLAISVN